MDKFLNSKTMVTPGIAGGLTTLITGVMTSQFNLPGKWVALAFSFLFGLTVLLLDKYNARLALRLLFLILNTFIIFSVAVGANATGMAANTKWGPISQSRRIPSKTFFNDWFSDQ